MSSPAASRRWSASRSGLASQVTSPRSTSPKGDRKSTRLNSSHSQISYAVFCLKKKKNTKERASSRLGHLSSTHHNIRIAVCKRSQLDLKKLVHLTKELPTRCDHRETCPCTPDL